MIEFNESMLNDLHESDKPIVLKFYAEWCGPCKMYAPMIESFAAGNDQYDFYSVNVEHNHNLAQHFGISSIPATVVVQNKEEVARFVGMKNPKELQSWLSTVL